MATWIGLENFNGLHLAIFCSGEDKTEGCSEEIITQRLLKGSDIEIFVIFQKKIKCLKVSWSLKRLSSIFQQAKYGCRIFYMINKILGIFFDQRIKLL